LPILLGKPPPRPLSRRWRASKSHRARYAHSRGATRFR
jgi:hypothetical protein